LALNYQLVTDQTNLILVHVREEGNKAEGLPELDKVSHMLAAGWGGVGSVITDSHAIRFSSRLAGNLVMTSGAASLGASLGSMSTPSVWRTRDRTSAAAKIDAIATGGMDAFEIPAFLRKQADDNPSSSIVGSVYNVLRSTTRAIDPGPIASPLDLLHAFDAVAGKLLAANRFVNVMQALHIPSELAQVLDDFTVVLGSGAKAWAVVIDWLKENLADQFILSRQGERLLRHVLKVEEAAVLSELREKVVQAMSAVKDPDWGQLAVHG
jgi:Ca-activated chloride channel family protein